MSKKRPELQKNTISRNQVPKTQKKSTTSRIRARKTKLPSRKTLENKIWQLCRQITTKKYGNTCYTTGQQNLTGANMQIGHGKPKGALPLRYKYDLRNLRPQSFYANIHMGGMTDIFIAKLEQEKDGLEFLQEACTKIDGYWQIKHIPPMTSMEAQFFLIQKIEEYKEILNNL